jgi:hypothetical protein
MQPSDIDSDAFNTAHELAMENTPEDRLEKEFTGNMTRYLISELARMGNQAVVGDRAKSALKIQGALEDIRETKNDQWDIFLRSKLALKSALEHTLAARSTFSDMPPSIRHITQKFSAVSVVPLSAPEKEEIK